MSVGVGVGGPDHEEFQELLPWYVNETLAAPQRARVESHLRDCEACRAELERERLIRGRMAGDAAIEYLPAPSLKRLQARLDEANLQGSRPAAPEPDQAASRGAPPRRALWAACAAIVAVLGLMTAYRWMDVHRSAAQDGYYTVTTPAHHPSGEAIRAVFAPTVTLVELNAILDESQLRIVSGPTEAGVYSLASTSTRPVADSLAILRRHASVRFAEPTQYPARSDLPLDPAPESSRGPLR
jgi:hypothetical protein